MKKFFDNLSIRTKVISGFFSVSFFLILICGISYLFVTAGKESTDNYNKCLSRYETIYNMRIMISQEISLFHEIALAESKFEVDSLFNNCEVNFRFFENELLHVDKFLAQHAKNRYAEIIAARTQMETIKKFHLDILIPAIKSVYHSRYEYIGNKTSMTPDGNPEDSFIKSYNSAKSKIEAKNAEVQLFLDKFNEHAGLKVEKATEASDSRYLMAEFFYGLLICFGILLLLITFPAANYFIRPFYKLKDYITSLGKGELPDEKIAVTTKDEIGDLSRILEQLTEGLKAKAAFAHIIQKNDFNHDFTLLSKDDILGNSLLEMSESLSKAAEMEKNRQVEEHQRSWATTGVAKFAEIMRKTRNNADELSDEIIKELVKYLNANQGGLFLYNDNNKENITLDLVACYAYDRKKYAEKVIRIKEGLVGTCAIEKEIIYMTNIPENYIEITSGLGDANPKSLILIPLKLEDTIFGVIEMASFNEIHPHEIQFLEKIAESIASTLSSVKINLKTQMLLKHSQEQSAQLTEQEEELRQNLEEMQATQDEMLRKEAEMTSLMNIVNKTAIVSKTDLKGIITYANDEFCKTSKYSRSELIGKNHNIVRHPDMPKEAFADLWQTIMNGNVWRGQVKNLAKDGSVYWVDATIAPTIGEDGKPYEYIAVRYLITEYKNSLVVAQQKTEELKGQQEELHRKDKEMNEQLIAINSTLATLEYDPNGNIINANEIFCNLFGYTTFEIIGKHHSIFFDNKNLKDSNGYKKFWEDIHAGKHFHGEMKRISKDGNNVIIIGSSHPFFDKNNNLVKVMEFTIDITEQKQLLQQSQQKTEELKSIEEELKQNLEEMHSTQEELIRKEYDMSSQLEAINKTLAVLEYDTNGKILKVNDIFCNILGYSENDLIGKHHSIVIEDKNLDSLAYKNFWQTIQARKHVQGEKIRISKDGSLKTVVRSSFPFLDTNGYIYKVLEVFIDITQQKTLMLESQLQSERQIKIELETKKLYENEIDEMFNLWYNHLSEIEKIYLKDNPK